ncbi:family 43 glycosylhydrolase [Microbacterium phyllosphaerae]
MRIGAFFRAVAMITLVGLATAIGAAAPAIAAAPHPDIANDTVWSDTAGNQIKAQGGNVFAEGSTWYWVGTGMDRSPDPANPLPKSINLYSSPDLANWTFVKALVTQSGDTGDLRVGAWLGRPQLIHNPVTGRYIIWVEVGSGLTNSAGDSLGNAQGVFESDSLTGTFAYQGKQLTNGVTAGDHSVFVEGEDAYLVYVGDSTQTRNVDMNIAPLSADWLTVGAPTWTGDYGHHEAPGIVKVGSTYYLFASGMNWWAGTPTSYRTSTDLQTWSTWSNVANQPASSTSFGTQFEQIIPVVGTAGTSYLYNGDRYSQFYGGGSAAPGGIGRNAWYPVTFSSGVPMLHGATDVAVNASAGTLAWNRVANGRFDQDVASASIPQWSSSGTAGAVKVQDTTSTASNRQLTLGNATAFNAWASQDLSVPNGTYTLKFDYKSSGGANNAYISLKNHGAVESQTSVKSAQGVWMTKTVTFEVTTGKVRIGAWLDGSGGQWLNLDNVSIWKN